LTGQPPYPAANPVAQLIRHATEAPRPLHEFDPALPHGLLPVLDRLLAKDPARRYLTPEAAARALRDFLPVDRDETRPHRPGTAVSRCPRPPSEPAHNC
jgi:serine/threonine protein kinase